MSKASEFAEKFKNSIEVSKVIEAHGKIKDSLRKDVSQRSLSVCDPYVGREGRFCI
jgi:hypothetical protein